LYGILRQGYYDDNNDDKDDGNDYDADDDDDDNEEEDFHVVCRSAYTQLRNWSLNLDCYNI